MPFRRPRDARRARRELRLALTTPARPSPFVVFWRWRYEIAIAAGLPAALLISVHALGLIRAIAGTVIITGLVTLYPPGRQYLLACAWCVITAHRVRAGCAQALILSGRGKLPIIMSTSRQPFGERVRLWCRAGTSVQDFVDAQDLLAAACWARHVVVSYDPSHTHLVILDVIRVTDAADDQGPPAAGPGQWGNDQCGNDPWGNDQWGNDQWGNDQPRNEWPPG